jgi:GAF domain-containing protein
MSTDEERRVQILSEFDVLYSDPSPNFDRITHIAALYFKTPISYISFISKDIQWLKSTFGMEAFAIKRNIAFCNETIKSDELFIVSDATKDVRFKDNPLVNGAPHIRFYAGAPITYQPGVQLGSVCVVDSLPRNLDRDERQMLTYLAELVVTELRLIKSVRLLRKAYSESRL